jgi:hypothetical protein
MFRSVAPGQYTIMARAISLPPRGAAAPADALAWGETHVTVAGDDLTGVSLNLRSALSISGRIEFKGTTAAPPLPSMRLPLPAGSLGGPTPLAGMPSVQLDGQRFTIPGVLPGPYRLQTVPPGIRAPIAGWWIESIVARGEELLDRELVIKDSIEDAVLTFSDRASELSGLARYANGLPYRDGLVVVFSADQRTWFLNSRRIAAVQPAATGRYVVRNLPPGDYFVTVAEGLERNEWFDPELLATLVETAQRVAIPGAVAVTHDVAIGR